MSQGVIEYIWLFESIFLSTCVNYVFNILPVTFPLYLLVTTLIQLVKLLFDDDLLNCKIAYRTIQGCANNKNYYYINVVCIQIVPHWVTNEEHGVN